MAVTLADVETAIAGIQEGGQSFTLDGFSYSAGNLSALIQLRDRLQREEARSSGRRPVFRAFNFTGMGYSECQ